MARMTDFTCSATFFNLVPEPAFLLVSTKKKHLGADQKKRRLYLVPKARVPFGQHQEK